MSVRRNRFNPGTPVELEPIVRLWLLRVLVPLGAQKEFASFHGFYSDGLANSLGLEQSSVKYEREAVTETLGKLHAEAERDLSDAALPPLLQRNLQQLADLVGLDDTDVRVLGFAVLLHSERLLDEACEWLGSLSSSKVVRTLAVVLNLPEAVLRQTLGPRGILARSGLLNLNREAADTLGSKLNLLSAAFADRMISHESDSMSLLRGTVSIAPAPELALENYRHIQPSLNIAVPYLRRVLADRRAGVNLFLHGVPGTGKSQLARVLAATLGCELFEVASEDSDGEAVDGEKRFRAFRAAQSFFSRRQALVVFDEAEDVFNDGEGMFGRKSTAQLRKAWLNRMLEENAVPTIWLSNTVEGLDPAFVRRFDMVFELPVPPQSQRQKILRDACGDLIGETRIERLAMQAQLAPAVIARAGNVVRTIRSDLDAEKLGDAFEHLISSTLQAQGHRPLPPIGGLSALVRYDPGLVQTDVDLAEVTQGIRQIGAGRLCLFGPPGTGKTAYGHWLAQQLERPLLIKRASDLLTPYVGQSERNIADAFREAGRTDSVLLLDEVDSFLQDRRHAQRSWEVSLVNEMLTQMESFGGLFIASTNLMTALDDAALRRFDLTVKFDYLQPRQAWALFRQTCVLLNLPVPRKSDIRQRLETLRVLTPGEFAAVVRQNRFRPLSSGALLLQALEAQCELKAGARPKFMGFVQSD